MATDAGAPHKACETYAVYSGQTTLASGWYVVREDAEAGSRIGISGDVHLILRDGATLTAPKGIQVTGTNSLTIWGQVRGTGALVVNGPDSGMAGIGGNNAQSCGVLVINGGTVTATGGSMGAGVGGGNGGNGGAIAINGGTVTATGGPMGAGIGGGNGGNGGAIAINGGTVTATGGEDAQAIGAGRLGDAGGLTLGYVKAGRLNASGSVDLWTAHASRTDLCRTVGATIRLESCTDHTDGDEDLCCDLCWRFLPHFDTADVEYLDTTDGDQTALRRDASVYAGQWKLCNDWYAVTGSQRLDRRLEIEGVVNLILCDGAELTLAAGFHVNSDASLTIWAQSTDPAVAGIEQA